MKRQIQKFTLLILSFFIIGSCDTVKDNFYEGNPYTCDYSLNLPTRKVLIEDFTGYQCVNCPRAAEEIHELLELYPCHVIPVAIHYGYFAEPFSSDDADYRTTEGTEIGAAFQIQEILPIGMVNRIADASNYNIAFEDWSTKIVDQLNKSVYADVEIICDASLSNNDLQMDIKVNEISALDAHLKLVAILTEDGIIGKQKDGSVLVEDYEHNHMLRTGLISENKTWGISIDLPFENTFHYSWSTTTNWVAENCHIIVYVYDEDSKEIIQAEQFEFTIE